MQKLLTILFIFLTVTTTEIPELLKIPLLVEHYLFHLENDQNKSLVEFLGEHYVGHEEKQGKDDSKQDNELPFKNIHVEHITSIFLVEPGIEINPSEYNISFLLPIKPFQFIRSSIPNGIFRPPRFA